MRKKLLLLNILVSLTFFSCWDYSLPNRIELEVDGSIELPMKISTSNWSSKLAESLQDAFSGDMGDGTEEIKVYDVNYGQDTQAFLVYMPIKIADSLNPDDYLKDINLNQKEGPVLEINESIEVPNFDKFTLDYQILPQKLLTDMTDFIFPSDSKIEIPITDKDFPLGDSISDYFLHAKIGEGYFTIDLDLSDGTISLPKDQFDYIYNISLSQVKDDSSPYPGLAYPPDPLDPSYNPISEKRSLGNQNINRSKIKINGSVILKPKAEGGKVIVNNSGERNLAGHLKIKMDISQFAEIDLDNTKILQEPFTVSFADTDIAKYINWIDFDICGEVDEKGDPTKGIGINMFLNEDIIDGLKMAITCSKLFFSNDAKPLKKGNNIFGNEKYIKLTPASETELTFKIELSSDSSSDVNVLHLKNLRTGQPLNIIGKADFFLKWKSAEVNVASLTGSDLGGTFPDEEPIDLSSLTEYFEDLNFSKMEAALYLSGLEMIEKSKINMTVDAKYNKDSVEHIIEKGNLETLKENIVIDKYLDGKGSYYKEKQLPQEGANYFDFETILKGRPDDLVFQYKLELPDKIEITSDKSFNNNGSEAHDIYATIMLLLHLELTAEDEGGRIKFPDMFAEDQIDLLGRTTPEENSLFTSLNVDYINYTVDFTSPFLSGGKLFIEKNNETQPKLFPDGIPLNGSKISFNIGNKELDIIRNNLIAPDLRLEFDPGETITIPKNIGVTSVKIEAKGKTSIPLDF